MPITLQENPEYPWKVKMDNGFFEIEAFMDSYLVVVASTPFLPVGDEWILEGTLSAGETEILIPPLSPGFKEEFPDQNIETVWRNELAQRQFTFYHYPALNSAEEYWQLSEKPWRDQLQYHSITVNIE
jgi:hypothetical protein